jgi:hypothetical protein
MSFVDRIAPPKSAHRELVAALVRVALVFAVAAIVATAARLTMGPPLY